MAFIKTSDSELDIQWRPYCEACLAELEPKGIEAICVLCQRSWPLSVLGASVVTPTPIPLAPPHEGGQVAPPVWEEADAMAQAWMDEYNGEPLANRYLTIEALSQFLVVLLVQEALDEADANRYDKWQESTKARYEASLKRATEEGRNDSGHAVSGPGNHGAEPRV